MLAISGLVTFAFPDSEFDALDHWARRGDESLLAGAFSLLQEVEELRYVAPFDFSTSLAMSPTGPRQRAARGGWWQ